MGVGVDVVGVEMLLLLAGVRLALGSDNEDADGVAVASVSIGTVSLVLLVSMLVGRLVGWLVSRMIRCWWLRFVSSVDGGFDGGFCV